jgi:hypothetical protein
MDEFDRDIAPLLLDVNNQIEIMNQCYEATFEGIDHCNPAEKDFIQIMRGVFERLDYITAKTKLIDKQKGDDEEVYAG